MLIVAWNFCRCEWLFEITVDTNSSSDLLLMGMVAQNFCKANVCLELLYSVDANSCSKLLYIEAKSSLEVL